MNNIFFFQTQQIPDDTILFDKFQKQNISFSYFQGNQNYYLFVYAQKSIPIDFLYHSIDVIQELDSKQRKIRSLRGFFLYALEIMETGKDSEILETNLQPFFWRKAKNIIRQNKKAALQEFLFGSQESIPPTDIQKDLKDKIESLENQVFSLQRRILDLETTLENLKYPLRGTLEAPDTMKSIQQDHYTLKPNRGSYLQENYERVNFEVREVQKVDSDLLSEGTRSPLKPSERNEQYLCMAFIKR